MYKRINKGVVEEFKSENILRKWPFSPKKLIQNLL